MKLRAGHAEKVKTVLRSLGLWAVGWTPKTSEVTSWLSAKRAATARQTNRLAGASKSFGYPQKDKPCLRGKQAGPSAFFLVLGSSSVP